METKKIIVARADGTGKLVTGSSQDQAAREPIIRVLPVLRIALCCGGCSISSSFNRDVEPRFSFLQALECLRSCSRRLGRPSFFFSRFCGGRVSHLGQRRGTHTTARARLQGQGRGEKRTQPACGKLELWSIQLRHDQRLHCGAPEHWNRR
jgi:hypothetical protein